MLNICQNLEAVVLARKCKSIQLKNEVRIARPSIRKKVKWVTGKLSMIHLNFWTTTIIG